MPPGPEGLGHAAGVDMQQRRKGWRLPTDATRSDKGRTNNNNGGLQEEVRARTNKKGEERKDKPPRGSVKRQAFQGSVMLYFLLTTKWGPGGAPMPDYVIKA